MPRLSSYSERIEQGIAESKLRQKQQLKRKAGGGKGDEEEEDEWSAGADGSRGRRGERGRQQQQQQFGSSVVAPPRTGKNGNASLALRQLERERESFETVLADNRTKMERKMKTLGGGAQTLYRQPDGTLGPQKPPRNPYTVAARKQFADLVHYCRITGGDEEYTKTSKSYRYNIGTGDTHAESSLYRQFPAHETETSHTSPVEFRHAFRHHTETRSAFRQYTHTHTHTHKPLHHYGCVLWFTTFASVLRPLLVCYSLLRETKFATHETGVRYEDHVRYLESLNMEPEVDALGNWIGYDKKYELPRPEEHPWSEMLEKLKNMNTAPSPPQPSE